MATFSSALASACARTFRRLTDPGHVHTAQRITEHFKVDDLLYYSIAASAVGGGMYLVEVIFGPNAITAERLAAYGEYVRKHFEEVGFKPDPVQLLPKPLTIHCHVRL